MNVYIVLRVVDDFFRLSFFAVAFELRKRQHSFHASYPSTMNNNSKPSGGKRIVTTLMKT